MNESKKVIFFTNIPAPYRVALFNDLEKIRLIHNRNFDFEVLFMRITESNRQWEVNLSGFKFKFQIGKGFYLPINGLFLHFNPGLIKHSIKGNNEIILGASWNNLNVLFIILLKRLRIIKNKLSIWSEANYLTVNSQKKNIYRDKIRNWVFKSIDGSFIVPGRMSIISFKKWSINPKKIIFLPNLISQNLFTKTRDKDFLSNKIPVFIIVARLNENHKGILNFIQSIGNNNIEKIKLRIIGQGQSKDDYKKYIAENKFGNHITFVGSLNQDEVSNEYDKADVFILPSYSDPSPLTVIEATNKGLPLLISKRCGNHFEAVKQGENGYIFNPFDSRDIKYKFELLLSQRKDWKTFSNCSLKIAENRFNNKKVLVNLIDCICKYDSD